MSKKNLQYLITNACITCQTCEKNCPVNAISFKSNDFKYEINTETCIKCGLCYRNCVYKAINKENI